MNAIPLAPKLKSIDYSAVSLTVVTITPAIAELYLAAVAEDRAPSTKSIDRLVTDMRAGNFLFTADPIKFATTKELIDGHNRLRAVIKSGVTITTLLATGVAADARNVIDTGSKFTLKHALERNGTAHAANVAAALTAVQAWERAEHTLNPLTGATTNTTSLAFLAAHPEIETIAHEAAKYASKIPTLTTKQTSALIWAFDKLDRDARTSFFTKLISGANLEANSPILQLRNLLADELVSVSRRSPRFITAVTIKAWNTYRAGTTVRALNFVGGGVHPQEFPIPR